MSSTSLAVIRDSISPTSAIAKAYGAIVVRASMVKGTSGRPGTGREEGSSPLSPTVDTAMPAATVMTIGTRVRDHRGDLREEHHQRQAADGGVDDQHMQIGEVATRTELSLRTIRHYEETGLVIPSARSQGGFRLTPRPTSPGSWSSAA